MSIPVRSGSSTRRVSTVTDLFDRVAAVYDSAVLQGIVYRPAQDELISELRQRRSVRVADVGCGTGILATRVATGLGGSSVVGCDLSDGMLSVARRRSRQVGWVRAASEALPLESASVDAVVSSHAFHFFDQPAALREFRRILVPGGVVAVVIVNPRTRLGSRLVGASVAGAGRFPDERAMRRLFVEAGFVAVRQRRVRRSGVRPLSPDLLTVGLNP